MSKKMSEMEDDERRDIEEKLNNKSSLIGISSWDTFSLKHNNNNLKDLIGICFNCKNMCYCKSEFGTVNAICREFDLKLNGQNRMTECSMHSPRGVMSLAEMYSIAWIIEPEEEKIEGFISKNKRLMNDKE